MAKNDHNKAYHKANKDKLNAQMRERRAEITSAKKDAMTAWQIIRRGQEEAQRIATRLREKLPAKTEKFLTDRLETITKAVSSAFSTLKALSDIMPKKRSPKQ